MDISGRYIRPGCEPYIIAEIGVNHDGDVQRALVLTDLAASAGADAVKLQYFQTDLLLSRAALLAGYQKQAGEVSPVEMLQRLELSTDAMSSVIRRAHDRGLHAIVTVFSVDLMDSARRLPWDAFKTASPDIIHKPLLEAIAADGRPMIVSTGASTLQEVTRAAEWLEASHDRLAMLQCVSAYPAPKASLEGIAAIAEATGLPTGYSDHTSEVGTGSDAVHAGACILERHITDDRTRPGPDHAASLTGPQFAQYAELARRSALRLEALDSHLVHKSKRSSETAAKVILPCERDVRRVSRQSIVTRTAIEAGETIRRECLTFKRPGTGLEPWQIDSIVGGVATRTLHTDTPIMQGDVAPKSQAA